MIGMLRPWYAKVLALVVVLAIFQLYGRYLYRSTAGRLYRIDRVTGTACRIPCSHWNVITMVSPTPAPYVSPAATGFEKVTQDLLNGAVSPTP